MASSKSGSYGDSSRPSGVSVTERLSPSLTRRRAATSMGRIAPSELPIFRTFTLNMDRPSPCRNNICYNIRADLSNLPLEKPGGTGKRAAGLAIDAAGNLHVAETGSGRILVLTGDYSWVPEGGCRHPLWRPYFSGALMASRSSLPSSLLLFQ